MNFLTKLSGITKLLPAIANSTGAGDAGKIPETESNGKLNHSIIPHSWVWNVFCTALDTDFESSTRHASILNTNAHFSPPVNCEMFTAVTSAQDADNFIALLYKNGTFVQGLPHPENTDIVIHTITGLTLQPYDRFYVILDRVDAGTVNDVAVEMHLREIV